MCGGVSFGGRTVYFPQRSAELPTVRKIHSDGRVTWGRREGEEGSLPQSWL